MSTTTPVPGHAPPERPQTKRSHVWAARRSVPHLVLGVLLVTASIAGAVLWSITTGERSLVLALTRSVTVGQPIASADLREVSVALDGAVDAIPATDAASVVGQLAAASLPAGVLLPRAALGTSMIPKPGDAIAALALEPGQVPPEVTQGTHVVVVLSADPNTESGSSDDVALESGWPAVVTGVSRPATERALVVSVLLAEDDARRVAASPVGRLSLVLVAEGGR